MDDRTLIERAAKAAGLAASEHDGVIYAGFGSREWDPLNDDGDALRLANRLKLNVMHGDYSVGVNDERDVDEGAPLKHGSAEERDRVTRRLIVRAAAALAEQRTGGRE